MKGKTIVFAATRKEASGRATVGYFKMLADVPADFTHPGEEDITGIMESMRLTDVDRCLRTMNSHWDKD